MVIKYSLACYICAQALFTGLMVEWKMPDNNYYETTAGSANFSGILVAVLINPDRDCFHLISWLPC